MRITGMTQHPEKNQLLFETDEGLLALYGIAPNIIRCVYTGGEQPSETSPLEICRGEVPKGAILQAEEMENGWEITVRELTLWIDREDGRFVWSREETGEILLEEGEKELTSIPSYVYTTGEEAPIIRRVKTVDGERNFVENLRAVEDHRAYRAKLAFRFHAGEQIHGLGQGEEGIYNYRGHVQYLYQHNMRIPVPFLLSDRGYAILADAGCLMTFNDDERGSYLFFDSVDQLDYYFIAGERTDDLIHAFRSLTGRAAMLPKWAFGYVQSREKYNTQEELLETARRYRELGVGLDCIVQDWKTWPDDDWGCKHLDKGRYPDLKKATKALKHLHVHSMVSVWPNMNYGTQDYTEMSDAGCMLHDLATYNAFDEKARAIYWEQCRRELFEGGFDSWWCDSTEPFSGPDWSSAVLREPWERFHLVGEEHKKYLGAERANLYAVAHAKGMFENQRKAAPEKRVLNLTRSGYAGIQKYGTVLWSGDIAARWDVLRAQVTEGLNMALSGLPYWTLDIGAFFVVHRNWQKRGCGCNTDPSMKWFWRGDYEEGLDDLGYRELYVRWFQYGAFLPMFRSHGTDVPREIWNFGAPGEPFYKALAKAIADRYRLMPYLYSMAGKVVHQDGTMVRSLLFDFPEDKKAAARSDAYLFGDSLLICPVTEPMYYDRNSTPLSVPREWTCYLPGGCGWYDFYTGTFYEGGQEVTVDCTLDHIPVFVREGSILPMEKGLTYAQEAVDTPLEFHIYPTRNQDATLSFLYYEDGGDDYGYEEGIFHQIPVTYEEKERKLTVGKGRYDFPGGIKTREYQVVDVTEKIRG